MQKSPVEIQQAEKEIEIKQERQGQNLILR
jgi:hypothetical protein